VANSIDTLLTYLFNDMIEGLLMVLKIAAGLAYRLDFAGYNPTAISKIDQMKFHTGGTAIDNQNAH